MAVIARRVRPRGLAAVVDIRPILQVIGLLLIVLALFMLPPMLADLVDGHPDWQVYFIACGITLFVGVSLLLMNRTATATELTMRQAFVLTTSAWLAVAVFASLPLAFSELDLSPADAFFEAMSGITTTGSTVIVGLDYAPSSLLLWRAILQWLGGIGIIVMGVAILPMLSVGGMQLFRTESTDTSEKILPRAAQIASAIGTIYVSISFACAVLYWLAGMMPFEAAVHAMTTVATGGYSTSDGSIGFFRSAAIEWIAVVFMIMGGVPFVLYIQFTGGDLRAFIGDMQVRWFLCVLLAAWLVVGGWIARDQGLAYLDALRLAAFNTTSMVTGTGYASADYMAWGTFPVACMFFLMCLGGCTGSTTGGIKMFRFAVLYATVRTQAYRLLQPHAVVTPTYNRRPLPEAVAMSVMAFFFLFALCFAVLVLMLSALGLDYLTAMSGALTALANVGPGLGDIIGPAGNFQSLPETAKWLLAGAMLLGRLELFTVLVLLAPAFWRV